MTTRADLRAEAETQGAHVRSLLRLLAGAILQHGRHAIDADLVSRDVLTIRRATIDRIDAAASVAIHETPSGDYQVMLLASPEAKRKYGPRKEPARDLVQAERPAEPPTPSDRPDADGSGDRG